MESKEKKHFTILSFENGGIRGIIPSIVLQYIECRTGKQISGLFSLVSGTSTGALLGVILTVPEDVKPINSKEYELDSKDLISKQQLNLEETESKDNDTKQDYPKNKKAKYSALEITKMYFLQGPKIFEQTVVKKLRSLGGLLDPRYSRKLKRQVISAYCSESLTLRDTLTDVLVPAFDMREGAPYFFKSCASREDDKYNYKLVDVLDATSSAPTYFKPLKVEGYDSKLGYRVFVDGALIANSPALCALAEAYRHYGISPKNTILVSLGCGDNSSNDSENCQQEQKNNKSSAKTYNSVKGWGALSWAKYFPNALISGSMYSVDYQIKELFNSSSSEKGKTDSGENIYGNYFRFQAYIDDPKYCKDLSVSSDIDNVEPSNMRALKVVAENMIRLNKHKLDTLCDLLVKNL